jgi:hypothetical protein
MQAAYDTGTPNGRSIDQDPNDRRSLSCRLGIAAITIVQHPQRVECHYIWPSAFARFLINLESAVSIGNDGKSAVHTYNEGTA